MFCFNYILTTPVDRKMSYTTGVGMPSGSFGWSIYPGLVVILGPGLQLFHITPSSKFLHENGFYYIMLRLLPNKWCSNQVSGFFIFIFLCYLLCVGSMLIICMRIVLLISWTLYRNKPIIFIVFFGGGAVWWVICLWKKFFITVSVYRCLSQA